jgi:hypothetical protein
MHGCGRKTYADGQTESVRARDAVCTHASGGAGLCSPTHGLSLRSALWAGQGEWLQSTFIGDYLACSATDTEVRSALHPSHVWHAVVARSARASNVA